MKIAACRAGVGLALLLAAAPAAPAQSLDGERLARFKCARCHVVAPEGGLGGIGSTPSFAAIRALEDWERRFNVFWTLAPHPSFTQVEGVTPPFHEERPSPIAPVELTLDEIEAIAKYAATIAPADLGPPLQ